MHKELLSNSQLDTVDDASTTGSVIHIITLHL